MSLGACAPPPKTSVKLGPDPLLTTPGNTPQVMADSLSSVLKAPPPSKPFDKEDIVVDPCPVSDADSLCPSGGVLSPTVGQPTDSVKVDVVKANTPKCSKPSSSLDQDKVMELTVLHVLHIPGSCNYEILTNCFSCYGEIREIRMSYVVERDNWEAWLSFSTHDAALQASFDIVNVMVCGATVTGALCASAPLGLDVYVPSVYSTQTDNGLPGPRKERLPSPPMWLVATGEESSYNYFKFCRYLQKKVGGIVSGDISRFGKNKVLIHAKSKTQSYMLCNLQAENDEMLKSIKPQMDFSYGRGVIFDRDLYDFDETEILDMCPDDVFQVRKLKGTTMIVFTFDSPEVPNHVIIENERIPVRPFKRKPLQCFKCFKFGHPSATCSGDQLCPVCSAPAHGACSASPNCANCRQGHSSRDKVCQLFRAEEAALQKSKADHISIPYAKKLLGQSRSYAQATRRRPSLPKSRQLSSSLVSSPAVSVAPMVQVPNTSRVTTPSSPSPDEGVHQASTLPDPEGSVNPLPLPVVPSGDGVQLAGTPPNNSPTRGRKRVGVSSPPPTFSIPPSNSFEVLASAASGSRKTQTPLANVS